jgi:hypothetical protein
MVSGFMGALKTTVGATVFETPVALAAGVVVSVFVLAARVIPQMVAGGTGSLNRIWGVMSIGICVKSIWRIRVDDIGAVVTAERRL